MTLSHSGTAPGVQPGKQILRVAGISRSEIAGSFVISAWVKGEDGKEHCIGHQSVLSRRHVEGCANCQAHLKVKSHMRVYGLPEGKDVSDKVNVYVHSHAHPLGKYHDEASAAVNKI